MSKKYTSKSGKERTVRAIIYIFLTLLCVIWLIPFIYLIFQAFRGESTSMVTYIIPKEWSFKNFVFLTEKTNFWSWYLNTFIIALFNAVLQTVIVLCVAYALSRMRFKGRKLLMNLMLVLGMFPGFLSMIATYFILKLFGLTSENSVPGLILVYAASSGMG